MMPKHASASVSTVITRTKRHRNRQQPLRWSMTPYTPNAQGFLLSWICTSLKRICWTTAGASTSGREIFEYFQAHKNLAERTEFLKNSYNDIWVEVLTDGVRTGYHAEKDGLLMWEGSYLSRTSESVFHGRSSPK